MTPDETLRSILASSFVVRVSHTGRRSGLPRVLETTYDWDGRDKVRLSGFPGKRDWVANLGAFPNQTLYTVEGSVWVEAPVRARVVRGRRERADYIMRYVARWTRLPGSQRRALSWTMYAAGVNRALRLPWWGPFYLVRRVFDRMPCVELTLAGPPSLRTAPPPAPTLPAQSGGYDSDAGANAVERR